MALPVNIDQLLKGTTVEWERLEFKKGWNPEEVIHTVTAFANDINNWGGGYIVIGVDEKDGLPVLPPVGVNPNMVDKIQKELVEYCHNILPNYFPIVEPVEVDGRTVLVIWVYAGQVRPYKVAVSLSSKENRQYAYYIRRGSITKKANTGDEKELLEASASVPFDDRVRQSSDLTDIKRSLVEEHLAEVGSSLLEQLDTLPFEDVVRRMRIADGPSEYLKPKNIGLLFFNNDPSQFFPCAQIDIVKYQDDIGDIFTEKMFSGPIQQQLRDSLLHLKNTIIQERVVKIPGVAESLRSFNYPFEAIEEALANTVFHRSYEDDSPIEVRVWPDRIEIVSYPGPLPPVTKEILQSGRPVTARKYRNRRIGDFLKELHLTEARGTGIPKIRRSMRDNGSPAPIFDTNDELQYFIVTLPIHQSWLAQVGAQVNRGQKAYGTQVGAQVELKVLEYCVRSKKRREVLSSLLGLYVNQSNYNKYMKPFVDMKYLELTVPDKPNSKNQEYKTTALGMARVLEIKEDTLKEQ